MDACKWKARGSCRLAAAIAAVPLKQCPVRAEQCAACQLMPLPTLKKPNAQVAELANTARAHSAPPPAEKPGIPEGHAPTELPCVHRSPAPVEFITCKPCQNSGIDKLPVYGCQRHGRCAIRGYSPHVANVCLTCEQRDNTPPKFPPVPRVTGLIQTHDGRPADHLADSFAGAGVFLVGGGYSLAEHDLTQLARRGVMVAAINQVGATHVRPQLWFAGDFSGRFHERIWRDPAVMKFAKRLRRDEGIKTWSDRHRKWMPSHTRVRECPNVWFYDDQHGFTYEDFLSTPRVPFSRRDQESEPPKKRNTKSTMFVALRLLYWLGFRRVYLLGVDFRMEPLKPYVFDEDGDQAKANTNNSAYLRIAEHLKNLRPLFEANDYQVWNCNPNSALTAFDHKPYEEALEQCVLDDSGFVKGLYSYVE